MALTKIKQARLELGLRQWDIAHQLGISESQISRIETGKIIPSDDLFLSLSKILEKDIADLK